MDGEVIRLRRLRERALETRALARAMDSDERSLNTALARSAHACWRIAKVVTGTLRGHPNLSCQKDYSPVRAAYDRVNAGFIALIARHRGTSTQVFGEALWAVARELDDARSLTWTAELSDTLGRAQQQMRELLREFEAAALLEVHAHAMTSAPLKSHAASRSAVRPASHTASRPAPRAASRPALHIAPRLAASAAGGHEPNAKPASWPYLAL